MSRPRDEELVARLRSIPIDSGGSADYSIDLAANRIEELSRALREKDEAVQDLAVVLAKDWPRPNLGTIAKATALFKRHRSAGPAGQEGK